VIWLVILVALAIPLAAVVLDSPVLRSWAERHRLLGDGQADSAADLVKKIETLEQELDATNREVAQLRESQQFLQRLLEDPAARQEAAKLPKPPA
jgi:TolA-binding protein